MKGAWFVLRDILKDLRLAKIQTTLSAFSMFIGIVAVIASVTVGTLGREYLEAINAQHSGWAPTYQTTLPVNSENTQEIKNLLKSLRTSEAASFTNKISLSACALQSISQLSNPQELYKKLVPIETHIVSDTYNTVFNLMPVEGTWFSQDNRQSVVVNKSTYSLFGSPYLVLNSKDSLTLSPFYISGVVNDGNADPHIYLRASDLIAFNEPLFSLEMATISIHPKASLSLETVQSRLQDISSDSLHTPVQEVMRIDQQESYLPAISMIELSLFLSAGLLLFVSILGQINIGLASLEKRTNELLIRRAIGASSKTIAFEILCSVILVSVLVSFLAIAFSVLLFLILQTTLLADGIIQHIVFPIHAAIIAVVIAIFSGVISGCIPAIKASRLEPALALR